MSTIAVGTVTAVPIPAPSPQKEARMSTIAAGEIVALPVAAVGAVAVVGVVVAATAAVAVAGAGAVILRESGRAVIGCGRELAAMADENLKLQRALQGNAQRYEATLRQQELHHLTLQAEAAQAQLAAYRAAQSQQAHRLRQLQQQINAPKQTQAVDWELLEALRGTVLNAAPPAPHTTHQQLSGWWRRVEQATALADSLATLLAEFTEGRYQGLYDTGYFQTLLATIQQDLAAFDEQADNVARGETLECIEQLEKTVVELAFLDQRLATLKTTIPECQLQRQTAFAALEQARVALDQTLATSEASASALSGLSVATQALDDAFQAFDAYEFAYARGAAEAVLSHVTNLADAVTQQRHRNALLFWQRLRHQVEPLREIPSLRSAVDEWLSHHQQCGLLLDSDLEAAWQQLTQPDEGLAAQAEALHRQALQVIQHQGAQLLEKLVEESLQEMGYTVQRPLEDGEPSTSLLGCDDQRRIAVNLRPSGQMAIKLDGFGDASCQTALRDLLNRLTAKGVLGAWQEGFSLSSAVQNLVSTLQRVGLDVKVEPTDQGATVMATGRAAAQASYDGTLVISDSLQQLYAQQYQQRIDSYQAKQTLAAEWEKIRQAHAQQLEALTLRVYNPR